MNARGIPTAAYQVLHLLTEVGYPPCWGTPRPGLTGGYPRQGTPSLGTSLVRYPLFGYPHWVPLTWTSLGYPPPGPGSGTTPLPGPGSGTPPRCGQTDRQTDRWMDGWMDRHVSKHYLPVILRTRSGKHR